MPLEYTDLFSSSSLLSDIRGGGKISGHKWGKVGGRPGNVLIFIDFASVVGVMVIVEGVLSRAGFLVS